MQLKNGRHSAFAAAALSLLGTPSSTQAQSTSSGGWSFDSSTLLYAEGDGRVKVFEPKLRAESDLGDDQRFGVTVTVDVLSGATPNGAAPYSQPQTFSQPHTSSGSSGSSSSGVSGGYTVGAYKLPTDPNFEDKRGALDFDYSFAPTPRDHLSVSASISKETDYLSLGGGGHWAHDFNNGSTTIGTGINLAEDTVNPVGGIYQPLSHMDPPGSTVVGPDSSKSKQVVDATLGLTQLLSSHALLQLNYSASRSSGYLNDPYKILSVVNSDAAPLYYVYEARPDSRLKQSVYLQYKQFVLGADVVDISYRFMTDDWGIRSHTVDATYRWNFDDRGYFEPHLRWYQQNQADFFHAALDQGQDTQVRFASSDPRLGAFNAYTGGLKYGDKLSDGYDWSVRVEYYQQVGQKTGLPPIAGPALSQFDVAPSLNAAWVIFGFGFR